MGSGLPDNVEQNICRNALGNEVRAGSGTANIASHVKIHLYTVQDLLCLLRCNTIRSNSMGRNHEKMHVDHALIDVGLS